MSRIALVATVDHQDGIGRALGDPRWDLNLGRTSLGAIQLTDRSGVGNLDLKSSHLVVESDGEGGVAGNIVAGVAPSYGRGLAGGPLCGADGLRVRDQLGTYLGGQGQGRKSDDSEGLHGSDRGGGEDVC